MNDILSMLQKTGVWVWNQKEKAVLLVLLGIFGFRVYLVVNGPTDMDRKPPAAVKPVEPPPPPPARPNLDKPVEFQGLVQRNPFTVYGISTGQPDNPEGPQNIGLTLEKIVPWSDGGYRAMITTAVDGRTRPYQEGEAFGDYRVVSIDPSSSTVVVNSSRYEKDFTLKAQNAT